MEDKFRLLPWKVGVSVGIYPRNEKMKKSWIWEASTVFIIGKEEMCQLTGKNGDATEGMVWSEREGSIEMLVKYEQILGVYCVHNTGRLYSRPVNLILLSSCGIWSWPVFRLLIQDLTPSLSWLRTLRREFCSSSTPLPWRYLEKHYICWNLAFLFCWTEAAQQSNITICH